MRRLNILFMGVAMVFLTGCSQMWISEDTNMADPVIFVPEDITVEVDSNFDIFDDVYCTDGDDGTIPRSRVSVTGPYDLRSTGVYYVTYTCWDEAGTEVSESRTITVVQQLEE